jgi:hypothetical protein
VQDVPESIALLSGDILQNLRSALDHLTYQLYLKGGGKPPGRHIYFPIERDAEAYKKEKARKTRGISATDRALIDGVKPYKEGNDTLWRIGELNIIDKHRLLITVGSSYRSVDLGAHMMSAMRKHSPDMKLPAIPLFFTPKDNLFPLETGKVVFSDLPGAEVIPEMEFRFQIVLHEPGIIEGETLIEVLQSMVDEVEKLKTAFRDL